MRVLVVEDNKVLAGGLSVVLKNDGYAVDVVGDGLSADAAIAAQDYDLVILDLTLPEMDGLDVLRSMRARRSEASVLVLTARAGVEDRVGASILALTTIWPSLSRSASWRRACGRSSPPPGPAQLDRIQRFVDPRPQGAVADCGRQGPRPAGARIERARDDDAGRGSGRVKTANHGIVVGFRRGNQRQRHRAVCQSPQKAAGALRSRASAPRAGSATISKKATRPDGDTRQIVFPSPAPVAVSGRAPGRCRRLCLVRHQPPRARHRRYGFGSGAGWLGAGDRRAGRRRRRWQAGSRCAVRGAGYAHLGGPGSCVLPHRGAVGRVHHRLPRPARVRAAIRPAGRHLVLRRHLPR